MNFPDPLLPSALLWAGNLLALLLLGAVVRTAPWKRLAAPSMLNLWLGVCVGLMGVWSIKAGIKPGLNFHLLGATLLTLMFGARLAMAGMAVVLAGITLSDMAGWGAIGVNWLLSGAWPVALSYGLYVLADRRLPHHLFVYIFVSAFIGAGAVTVLVGAAASGVLVLSGIYTGHYLAENYLPYYVFMGWSEAMLTGMAVTLMAVYRPHWLHTYSDARYLNAKINRGNG